MIDVERSNVKILLRDFDISGLDAKEKMLRDMVAQTQAKFPEVKITIDVKENYKNMKEVLKELSGADGQRDGSSERAGLKPFMKPIRGGTDGARLTFRGLPTPNLFTGGEKFSRQVGVQLAPRFGKVDRDVDPSGPDIRGKEQVILEGRRTAFVLLMDLTTFNP